MEIDLHKLTLITYRDHLFDKYLSVIDKREKWERGEAEFAIGRVTGKKETKAHMIKMIQEHLNDISTELRDLDNRICRFDTAEETFTKIKEIY